MSGRRNATSNNMLSLTHLLHQRRRGAMMVQSTRQNLRTTVVRRRRRRRFPSQLQHQQRGSRVAGTVESRVTIGRTAPIAPMVGGHCSMHQQQRHQSVTPFLLIHIPLPLLSWLQQLHPLLKSLLLLPHSKSIASSLPLSLPLPQLHLVQRPLILNRS